MARRPPSAPLTSEERRCRFDCWSISPALPESSQDESPLEESPEEENDEESLASKSLKGGVGGTSPLRNAACRRFFMNIALALKYLQNFNLISQSMYRSAKAKDHSVKFSVFTIEISKPGTVLLEELLTAK